MRTTYANTARVLWGPEDVSLLFGFRRSLEAGEKQQRVTVSDRIIMSPQVAKQLCEALARAVASYESSYGPLAPAASAAPAGAPEASRGRGSAHRQDAASLLFGLVNGLGVSVGYERSFKIFDRLLLPNRYLLGFSRSALGRDGPARILDICRRIGMPAHHRTAFADRLAEANIVLFGYEENEGTKLYKAYLEFGGRFAQRPRENAVSVEPFLLHLGFKWDIADNRNTAVARYRCLPVFSAEQMLARVEAVVGPAEGGGAAPAASLLKAAAQKTDVCEFLYLEVEEEDNPRQSYDINVYRAHLHIEDLWPMFDGICRRFSIPRRRFAALIAPLRRQVFGHLSGGIDRHGREFVTIYYGVKGSSSADLPGG